MTIKLGAVLHTLFTKSEHNKLILIPSTQVYVNDMQCGVTSYMNLFADDAKLMRVINSAEDCRELQSDRQD